MTPFVDDNHENERPENEDQPTEEHPYDFEDRPDPEEAMSQDELEAALSAAMPVKVAKGDIIKGIVAAVDDQSVSVDIGSKDEGIIPLSEFSGADELPRPEDEIEVAVVKIDERNGVIKLSKRRADYERVWNRLVAAAESGEIVEALVTERVKGGLRVDVGVPGFVPGSQVAARSLRNLERFVGQSLRLKVLEADRKSKKVVLSHRLVVDEEREQRRKETVEALEEGMICEGKVRSLTNYGAFIDLGGIDGLLHVSEMAWTRIKHPSEVLQVGDTVRVAVLDIDMDNDRISLSRRQILPDPWNEAAKKLNTGMVVKGRITRIVRTGAFAQLPEYDIEGFIPISEMSDKRISDPSEVLQNGQEVDLKVVDVRTKSRRLTLSVREAVAEKERREYQKYMATQETGRTTLGDKFGAILMQAVGDAEAQPEPADEPEAEAEPEDVEEPDVEAEEDAEQDDESADQEADEGAADADAADDDDDDADDDEDDDDEDADDDDADDDEDDDDEDEEEADDDEDDDDEDDDNATDKNA